MMGKFRNTKNDFMQRAALQFFGNFIQNHQDIIENNDCFAILDGLIPSGGLIRYIKASFSERKLKALQSEPCRHDRLDFDDEPKEMLREIWCNIPARKTLRIMIQKIIDDELSKKIKPVSSEIFSKRLNELQATLALSDFERDILFVLLLLNNSILTVADGHGRRTDETGKIIFVAKCLDCATEEVLSAVAPQQRLRRYNCIDGDIDFNNSLRGFLLGTENEPLANNYFQKFQDEVLPFDFYGELGKKHGAILSNIIRSGGGKTPVNILLYGAPGTGKTSFAKTLAAKLQLDCYCVAQNTNDNRSGRSSSTPEFRFGALQICDAQVDPARSIMIVDEADDMLRTTFSGGGLFAFLGGRNCSATGNKGLLNNVLDQVKTPTIWITNTWSWK